MKKARTSLRCSFFLMYGPNSLKWRNALTHWATSLVLINARVGTSEFWSVEQREGEPPLCSLVLHCSVQWYWFWPTNPKELRASEAGLVLKQTWNNRVFFIQALKHPPLSLCTYCTYQNVHPEPYPPKKTTQDDWPQFAFVVPGLRSCPHWQLSSTPHSLH